MSNEDKKFSDKLADIAEEAEKDHTRKKFDPLENYEIEGPDVRDEKEEDANISIVPLAPQGNPTQSHGSQNVIGNLPVTPIIPHPDNEEDDIDERRR